MKKLTNKELNKVMISLEEEIKMTYLEFSNLQAKTWNISLANQFLELTSLDSRVKNICLLAYRDELGRALFRAALKMKVRM